MSGPWDKYASGAPGPQEGPWARYAAPPATQASASPRKAAPAAPARRSGPSAADEVGYGLATLYRSIPFADEINDGLWATGEALADFARGKLDITEPLAKPIARNYAKAQARTRAAEEDLAARRPITSNLVKGTGLAAQVVPVVATGGAAAAPAVAARTGTLAAGRGLLASSARAQKAVRVLQPMVNSAVAGALSAEVGGLGGEGSLAERLEAGNRAAPVGALIGAAAPPAIAVVGKGLDLGGGLAKSLGRTGVRLANRASRGALLDPEREAARRMAEALHKDGLGPEQIIAALDGWKTSGASDPALMDLAGENTRALLRAAASKTGPARNTAVRYADEVAGNLQDNAIGRAWQLAPEHRTAGEFAADLEKTQRRLADRQYAGPYQTQVPLTDEVITELSDGPGMAALQEARADALERRAMDQVAEIDRFIAGLEKRGGEAGPVKLPDVEAPAAPFPAEDPRGGNSLMTWIRQNGGVRDPHGEFQAMDLGRDRGRFQDHHIINPNGMDPDEAARKAWEEGFFPDAKLPGGAELADNYTPVTAEDLRNAIDREVRGRPHSDAWEQEEQLAAEHRWMDDAEDTLPPTDEGYWQSLEAETGGERPTLSGATLDRTRIALRERGDKFSMRGNNARAGGSFGRMGTLDTVLDAAPGIQAARRTYRRMASQIDAVPLGQKALNLPPAAYGSRLNELVRVTRKARPAAAMGHRQAIVDAIGAPAEGSTGLLNRLATSTNQRENLAASFGPVEAGRFQDAMANEITKLRNARYVSPNTGSQTDIRNADRTVEGLVDIPPLSKMAILKALLDKLRRGLSLTDAERDALVKLGVRPIRSGETVRSIPLKNGGERLLTGPQRRGLERGAAVGGGALAADNERDRRPAR